MRKRVHEIKTCTFLDPCPNGEYKSSDMTACTVCGAGEVPNQDRTACGKIEVHIKVIFLNPSVVQNSTEDLQYFLIRSFFPNIELTCKTRTIHIQNKSNITCC